MIKNFDFQYLQFNTLSKFKEVIETLSSYSRFLFFASVYSSMQMAGCLTEKEALEMTHKLSTKINVSFFYSNIEKNTELCQEWFQELIDKKLIQIGAVKQK